MFLYAIDVSLIMSSIKIYHVANRIHTRYSLGTCALCDMAHGIAFDRKYINSKWFRLALAFQCMLCIYEKLLSFRRVICYKTKLKYKLKRLRIEPYADFMASPGRHWTVICKAKQMRFIPVRTHKNYNTWVNWNHSDKLQARSQVP